MQTLACRAVWRVQHEHLPLAHNLTASKRLTLDDMLVSISGIMYFFSCVTVMKSNVKRARTQTDETGNRLCYPGVAYFLCFRRNEVCNENKIFAALHNADMEPTIAKIRTRSRGSSLLQVLKDHSNVTVQNLLETSNTYCYRRAMNELHQHNIQQQQHSFPSKPCRLVLVNEEEMLEQMTQAFERLQSDGLIADFVTMPNPNAEMLPTDASEVTQTIRDIDRVMELCDQALYRGHVYARPNHSTVTFVHMMSIESYLHHLLSNDSLRERVLRHFSVLQKILAHNDCTVIRQLQFDNDLIEVEGGVTFQISKRKFISCPITGDSIRKISPRAFVRYDSTTLPDADYFQDAIVNSFPDLVLFDG